MNKNMRTGLWFAVALSCVTLYACGDESGQQAQKPSNNEIVCGDTTCNPDTQECKDNVCVDKAAPGDPCDKCGENQTCENGVCKDKTDDPDDPVDPGDPCSSINCDSGKACLVLNGAANCYDEGCIEGEGLKSCGEGQTCSKGECIDDGCKDKTCNDGESCVAGLCIETACIDKSCDDGFSCKGGECIENACLAASCEAGEVCIGGDCILEACKDVQCPAGKACAEDGNCHFESAPELIVSVNDKVTNEEGKSITIQVSLSQPPTADVTVTYAASDDSEAKACDSAPCTITFNADNYNHPQAITITGLPDGEADGDQKFDVSLSAASSDKDFDGLKASVSDLVNQDIDKAGVNVSVPDAAMTTEKGGTVEIKVSLSSKPASDVTFSVSSDKTTEGTVDKDSITFTPENWNVEQIITVTGVADGAPDDPGANVYHIVFGNTVSEDASFNGLEIAAIELINQDLDKAGVTVTATSIEVDESDKTAPVGIVLNNKPNKNVTIKAVSNDMTEATISPAEITFTPENWDQVQTFTVSGVQDNEIDGDQNFSVTFSFESDQDAFKLDPLSLLGKCIDTTKAGVNVIPETLTLNESGTKSAVQISLAAKPTKNVKISLAVSDKTEIDLDGAELTFTPDNWDKAQTINVIGVDDYAIDGNQESQLTLATVSDDANFNALEIAPITFITEDNDSASLIIEGEPKSLKEEAAENASYYVSLGAQPASIVTVNLQSSDNSELALTNSSSLKFTVDNWNEPQAVEVVSVDDMLADKDQVAHIAMTSKSNDKTFDGLKAKSPEYTIVDNETANLVVIASNTTISKDTNNAQIKVRLSSAPEQPVSVMFVSSNTNVANIDTILTFNKNNYDKDQIVGITLEDYDAADTKVEFTVKSASASAVYDGLSKKVNVRVLAFIQQDFAYTGNVQTVSLYPGEYKFEAWGAGGGGTWEEGHVYPGLKSTDGKGAYSAGILTINEKTDFYIYVGGRGADAVINKDSAGGWNGGGTGTWDGNSSEGNSGECAGGGGGATDFRLVNGNWDNFDSLKSRIMVAGGGSGRTAGMYYSTNGIASCGGGLVSCTSTEGVAAATQTSGYKFGVGQSQTCRQANCTVGGGGAGGGYYGGLTKVADYVQASGGSGFISGYEGCDAITEDSTENKITHTGKPTHYSGLYFTEAVMKSGNETMPAPGGNTEIGHDGNGYARIKLITE